MVLTDIIGPVMIGPSSSHTAGAARIGKVAYKLLAEPVRTAEILLHGSFLAAGKGHGTDKAIVAGLLGLSVDDSRLPQAFALADRAGMRYEFGACDLGAEAHPNSVRLNLTGAGGRALTVCASSVGGGRIQVFSLDGLPVVFSGDMPTLVVHLTDRPGTLAGISTHLMEQGINIATARMYRARRGGNAVMVFECDQEVRPEALERLREKVETTRISYLSQAHAVRDAARTEVKDV